MAEPVKVAKIHKTNRSRLYSSIAMLTKDTISNRGKAPVSATGVALLEDLCKFFIKRTMEDCSRMMDHSQTVTLRMVQSGVRMGIRDPRVFSSVDVFAMGWVTKWSAAQASASREHKFMTKTLGRISASRVRKLMRKTVPGCKRLSFTSAIYLAGALQQILITFIKNTHEGDHVVAIPKRLGVNDFYVTTLHDSDLSSIIPHTMIVPYGGVAAKMSRRRHKRSSEESEAAPAKKKARKAPKKKKAPAAKKVDSGFHAVSHKKKKAKKH